jgi:hypothetical protein
VTVPLEAGMEQVKPKVNRLKTPKPRSINRITIIPIRAISRLVLASSMVTVCSGVLVGGLSPMESSQRESIGTCRWVGSDRALARG